MLVVEGWGKHLYKRNSYHLRILSFMNRFMVIIYLHSSKLSIYTEFMLFKNYKKCQISCNIGVEKINVPGPDAEQSVCVMLEDMECELLFSETRQAHTVGIIVVTVA